MSPVLPPPAQNSRLAVWLATIAVLAMTAMSAIIHEAAKAVPVGQLVFWRSAAALLPIVFYMGLRRQIAPALRTRYPHKHLIRGLLGGVVMVLNFTALGFLSVGLATALGYLAPILSVFAAMLFLRERPGAMTLLGVVLGFGGILVMLFPALLGADLRAGTLVGIAAAIGMAATNALSRVQVKDLTRTDPPASIALSFAVIATLFGLATVPFGWAPLDGGMLALLIGAGLLGGVGHIVMMEAVARAPVSMLAGIEYTGIVWAFAFDVVLLGIALDPWSVVGALVVVGAAALVGRGHRAAPAPVTKPTASA